VRSVSKFGFSTFRVAVSLSFHHKDRRIAEVRCLIPRFVSLRLAVKPNIAYFFAAVKRHFFLMPVSHIRLSLLYPSHYLLLL